MSVPEGWRKTTVGEACAIKNHLRLPISTEVRSQMKGNYPYFGPTGILGYIDEFRIDEEFALIGEDGDHFLKYNEKEMTVWHHGKANINNHAHIVCNSEECLVIWFQRYFQHRDITDALTRQGAKRYKLTKNALEHLEILLPPFAEQKKIAAILSTWDKAIAAMDKLLENTRQQKKALMQQLLTGKERLPDFSGKWREISLSKFCSRITERNNGASKNVMTISGQQGFVPQRSFFSKQIASDNTSNYFLVKKGDFVYNKSYCNGYPMGAIKRLTSHIEAVVTTLYICFSITENYANSDYMEQYFEAGLLNNKITQIAAEGGRAHGLLNVKPADFMALKIPLPPLPEQQAIARVLTTADKEIDALTRKVALLRQEKRALMQQLLTGKKRVQVEA